MGLFIERTPSQELSDLAIQWLAADPQAAESPAAVSAVVRAATAATGAGTVIVNGIRILVSLAIGAGLLAAGAFLVWQADQQAIAEAAKAAANPAYKPPNLGIAAVGTSLITLGGAWSAALVGVILSEK